MFGEEIATLRRLGIRHLLLQALNFANVISTALMMWKGLAVLTNCESPIVVVLSGSMEPAFKRGDLLFLDLPRQEPLRVGDITVYNVPGASIPIVHRVIEVHDEQPSQLASAPSTMMKSESGVADQWILTKGDNNAQDDIGLYNGLRYLRRSNIVGKVRAYMPYVGYVTIMMNDYPQLKYGMLGLLGVTVLFTRE